MGPWTTLNQLLAMRKGLSLLAETNQDFSVLSGGMDTQTWPANNKEQVTRVVTQQCQLQSHMNPLLIHSGRSKAQCLKIPSYQIKLIPRLHIMRALHTYT